MHHSLHCIHILFVPFVSFRDLIWKSCAMCVYGKSNIWTSNIYVCTGQLIWKFRVWNRMHNIHHLTVGENRTGEKKSIAVSTLAQPCSLFFPHTIPYHLPSSGLSILNFICCKWDKKKNKIYYMCIFIKKCMHCTHTHMHTATTNSSHLWHVISIKWNAVFVGRWGLRVGCMGCEWVEASIEKAQFILYELVGSCTHTHKHTHTYIIRIRHHDCRITLLPIRLWPLLLLILQIGLFDSAVFYTHSHKRTHGNI